MELTYRVRVTAGVGEMLTLPAGTVGGLATRCLSWSVAAKPLPPAAEGAAEAAVEALTAQGLTKDLSCVSEFCRRVWGWEAGLPQDMQHLLDGLFDLHPIVDADDSCARMLKPTPVEALTPEFRRLRAMSADIARGIFVADGNDSNAGMVCLDARLQFAVGHFHRKHNQ